MGLKWTKTLICIDVPKIKVFRLLQNQTSQSPDCCKLKEKNTYYEIQYNECNDNGRR